MAITLVQSTSVYAPSGNPSVAFPSNVTSGNLLVAAGGSATTTPTGATLDDTLTSTWTLTPITTGGGAAFLTNGTLGYFTGIYFATAGSTGADTVTFTPPVGSAGFSRLFIFEFTGGSGWSVDQAATGASTSTTASAGPVSTTVANEAIVAFPIFNAGTPAAGTGFTGLTAANNEIAEYQIVSSTGSYTATATTSTSTAWMIQMVTFQGGGGGTLHTQSTSGGATFTGGMGRQTNKLLIG